MPYTKRAECCCPPCWSFADSFCCTDCDPPHCDALPNLTEHWVPLPHEPEGVEPLGNWWVDADNGLLIEDGTPGAMIRNSDCVPYGKKPGSTQRCKNADVEPNLAYQSHCLETTHTGLCSPDMRASFAIYNVVRGDIYSLYLQLQDTQNYLEVRYSWNEEGNSWYELYEKRDGTEQLLARCGPLWQSGTTIDVLYISGCVDDGNFYGGGQIIETPLVYANVKHIKYGFHGGIGHQCDHQVYFSNWEISQTFHAADDCPSCGICHCQDTPDDPIRAISAKLVATCVPISEGGEGNCGAMPVFYLESTMGSGCVSSEWHATVEDDNPCWSDHPGTGRQVLFDLMCGPIEGSTHVCCDLVTTHPSYGDFHNHRRAQNWRLIANSSLANYANPAFVGFLQAVGGSYDGRSCPTFMNPWPPCGALNPAPFLYSTDESTCNPFKLVFDLYFSAYGPVQVNVLKPPTLSDSCWPPCNCIADFSTNPTTWWGLPVHYKLVITEMSED